MLFPLPTNNASLGSAAPYSFPKAEGCSGDAPFGFSQRNTVQHLLTQLPSGTNQKQHKSETLGLIFLIFDMYKRMYNLVRRPVFN
jgi:hypothetical protein